jgi:hypothetical protein
MYSSTLGSYDWVAFCWLFGRWSIYQNTCQDIAET